MEKETGERIIEKTGLLMVGNPTNKSMKAILEQKGVDGYGMTIEEAMSKYPALTLPKGYTAWFEESAGIVRARVGLEALAQVATKRGADLRYGKEVRHVTERSVELEDGTVFEGKNVVVCCGPRTERFLKEKDVEVIPTEYMTFTDPTGLPETIAEFADSGNKYALLDGEKMDTYKVGLDYERNITTLLDYIDKRMPSKRENLYKSQPCFYTRTPDAQFRYVKKDGVAFVYAFSGHGFKFTPFHGKMAYKLITEKGKL